MRLPSAESAEVDIAKLRDYCLDPMHPIGKHKARAFAAALGIRAEQAWELRAALLDAARDMPAIPGEKDAYGERYMVDFGWTTQTGEAMLRSVWMVRSGEDHPRLVTCFVL